MNKESKTIKVNVKSEPDLAANYTDYFGNEFELPSAIKQALKDQGLVARFVNASKFRDEYSVHRGGWQVYNARAGGVLKSLQGADPEGIIRRGDLVLAVRTVDASLKHKKVLKQMNGQLKNINKLKAEELRDSAKAAGVEATVIEGYEGQKMGQE